MFVLQVAERLEYLEHHDHEGEKIFVFYYYHYSALICTVFILIRHVHVKTSLTQL